MIKTDHFSSDELVPILILILIGVASLFLTAYSSKTENEQLKKKLEKYKGAKILITCMYCKGNGFEKSDSNKIMAEALCALWHNKHIMNDKCTECDSSVKGSEKYCDVAKNQFKTIMEEYEKKGPKIEKNICKHCMGMGQFVIPNKDGSSWTQSDYEEREKNKK